MRLTGGQLTAGELAVDGFFILSGFLIAQSWENTRSLGRYFTKRTLRIYPGFLVAVLFSGFIIAPFLARSASEYWRQFSSGGFLLSALNLELRVPPVFTELPVPALNGSLWSIRYEFLCYVGVALLGMTGALRNRLWVVAALVVSFTLQVLQVYFDLKVPGTRFSFLYCYPGFWPRMASLFLAGVVFYLYREHIRFSAWLFMAALLFIVALSLIPSLKFLPLALPFLGTYIFFYLAFLPTPALQKFARRGDFSYGVYLYAYPLQQLLVRWCGPALTPLFLFAVAVPLTLILAFLSWHLVEKRFLVRKPTGAPHGLMQSPKAPFPSVAAVASAR
jgi:peptidoglycan/LPS O-acetylase OafA/YrhL